MYAPRVWFPAIRAGSGADVFTERLADALNNHGIRAEITWLPHRTEYAPWSVPVPKPPQWANVVHINTWLHPRFIPPRIPVVATMHHVVHDPAFAPYRTVAQAAYHRFWIKPIEAAVLRRAQAVTAVSSYTANQVRAVFDRQDVTVIPNGIDTDIFHPGPDRPPHHPFRLLFVGNWSRRKGTDLLPPIMQGLGPDFELWVTSGLRDWRDKTPLPANIRFLGRVPTTEALVRVYQDADALLFPSRLEGFGLAALEALACGLPIVATDGSALSEVLQDCPPCQLCPPDDVDAFVRACKYLRVRQSPVEHVSDENIRRVRRLFSSNTITDRYMGIYYDLLKSALP
jgi:glycosyltransferase involved in cell wall biosynthesis